MRYALCGPGGVGPGGGLVGRERIGVIEIRDQPVRADLHHRRATDVHHAGRVIDNNGRVVGKRLVRAAAAAGAQNDLGDVGLGDIHASESYRRAMVAVYVKRALTAAAERAQG